MFISYPRAPRKSARNSSRHLNAVATAPVLLSGVLRVNLRLVILVNEKCFAS